MYQVAVLDDNELSAHMIADMACQHVNSIELEVHCFTRLSDLTHHMACNRMACDIVFMDIELAEDEPNGIDVTSALFKPDSGTQVIYVSGRSDMHAKVYRTKHVSFLTKPINEDDFSEALDRALSNLREGTPEPIRVHVGRNDFKIFPHEVSYIESKGRVVEIHLKQAAHEGITTEAKVIRTYMQLGELGELLGEGFARVHQSYLVNLDDVVGLGAHDLTLTDGARIPVSRRRSVEVRELFFSRIRGL